MMDWLRVQPTTKDVQPFSKTGATSSTEGHMGIVPCFDSGHGGGGGRVLEHPSIALQPLSSPSFHGPSLPTHIPIYPTALLGPPTPKLQALASQGLPITPFPQALLVPLTSDLQHPASQLQPCRCPF